ncbi:Rust resistance kinase Lr10 [Vitis vinifera]|uniref:non-specific serine/threonine protein kinase n=1 Tax=Vitis vinifera TaxID=29760 RepID=A0A438C4W1_VITVI|nr:Rust resistance kinase Lr10 [Vitis vinifera]
MLRRIFILYPGFAALLLLLLVPITCKAKRNHRVCTSSCGNIHNISYPFRLKDDPRSCGESEYELACETNRTILYLYSGKYKVEEINYEIFTIRIVDTGLQKDDCSSLPLHSLTYENFTLERSTRYRPRNENLDLNFIDCEAPISSSLYMDMAPCSKNSSAHFSLSSIQTYSYVVVGYMSLSDLQNSCRIDLEVSVSTRGQKIDNSSCSGIHDGILYGTDLQWCKCLSSVCPPCVAIVAVRTLFGSPCVVIFLIYKWRRRNLSMYHAIEEFIQAQNNLNTDKGSKRALVYDFMPNGSLDKYIFPEKEGNISLLSLEKMYEISLGVAYGIEYLHRGCDTQILHFDIKPHNILLDKNFTPKVSDFGLAKSYPTDHSIVSLTAARGTRGYMAPELFYKNIGGVSYKADVYSFGMLLMEMAGRRKNLNVFAEHSSQIYFPSWPSDRPSMNKVLEMLEGNVELLQMPPKPLLTPQEVPAEDHVNNKKPAEMSISIR